jgi:O-acetyl-ADP-ribose deacetylase (regulator of RNase III)
MITFTKGNMLDADVDALVNTVNAVGVMGKGIALMFKERFPDNYKAYEAACKRKEIKAGSLFVTEQLMAPRWIINFATKQHWRNPSKIEWIESGLSDLRSFIVEHKIKSIALPPLGSGNGGLDWGNVRPMIEDALGDLTDVQVLVYEPTQQYQNVTKRQGVEKLTPARALIADIVRRYWIVGMECTVLEVQKLAYFIERVILASGLANPLKLEFRADKYGPFSHKLNHLLNALDGSYLHCGKRLADAGPFDLIWFEEMMKDRVAIYLNTEAKSYRAVLDETASFIDGFESALGMELLATVHWLIKHEGVGAGRKAVKEALPRWPGGTGAGARKLKLFDDRLLDLALERVTTRA